MTIATRRTTDQRPEHLHVLFGGYPGSALARTAATWPDPLFAVLGVLGGHLRSLADSDVAYVPIDSLDALKELLAAVAQPPAGQEGALGHTVGTLVVHTVNDLPALLGDDPGGDRMQMVLRVLTALPLHVVLLCRLPEVAPHVDSVAGLIDAALLLEPVICIETVGDVVTRTRRHDIRGWPSQEHPWVIDYTGRLPERLEANFDDDFTRLAAVFGAPPQDLGAARPARRRKAAPVTRAVPAPPPASAETRPEETAAAAAAAPIEQPDEDETEEDETGAETCADCGGSLGATEVEVAEQKDLAAARRHEPLCRTCEAKFMAAQPRVIPRKARPAAVPAAPAAPAPTTPPPAATPEGAPTAVVPRGEVVGRIAEPTSEELRKFMDL